MTDITHKYNSCTVDTLTKAVDLHLTTNIPLMIFGPPGVGKSDIIGALTEQHDMELIDVRLGSFMPEDLGGIPVPNHKTARVERFMPDLIERVVSRHEDTGRDCVLFLDEITSANGSVLAPAYQLVRDRELAGYKLPKGTRIIAAGNRAQDRGVVNEMPAPLLNRMGIIEYLGPTKDEFLSYASNGDVHPTVMTFLERHPEWICSKINPEDPEGRFPSPRSWEHVGDALRALDKRNASMSDRLFHVSAFVGDAAALAFETVLRLQDKLVPYEEVLRDPEGVRVDEENIAVCYMQMTTVVQNVESAKDWLTTFRYIERLPKELMGAYFRQCLARDKTSRFVLSNIAKIKEYQQFVTAGYGLAKAKA